METHEGKYASDSKHIPRVPQVAAGIKLEYSLSDFSLVLDANYTGRMYIDYCEEEDVTLPGSKIVHTSRQGLLTFSRTRRWRQRSSPKKR